MDPVERVYLFVEVDEKPVYPISIFEVLVCEDELLSQLEPLLLCELAVLQFSAKLAELRGHKTNDVPKSRLLQGLGDNTLDLVVVFE